MAVLRRMISSSLIHHSSTADKLRKTRMFQNQILSHRGQNPQPRLPKWYFIWCSRYFYFLVHLILCRKKAHSLPQTLSLELECVPWSWGGTGPFRPTFGIMTKETVFSTHTEGQKQLPKKSVFHLSRGISSPGTVCNGESKETNKLLVEEQD